LGTVVCLHIYVPKQQLLDRGGSSLSRRMKSINVYNLDKFVYIFRAAPNYESVILTGFSIVIK